MSTIVAPPRVLLSSQAQLKADRALQCARNIAALPTTGEASVKERIALRDELNQICSAFVAILSAAVSCDCICNNEQDINVITIVQIALGL